MKKQPVLKINYGCGETKLKGFVNVDIEKKVKPDLVCDLRKHPFPFKPETIDIIQCIHNIEHIEQVHWPVIFGEFWRVLKPGGLLYLAYPEFERCAKNFLENHKGQRNFWRATLYGRQLYPGDYHVVPMVTGEVVSYLSDAGFNNIKSTPEPSMPYNTFVVAYRSTLPKTKEIVLREEIFGKV
jgi:predicted SAM-dependent methyltransferase